MSPLCETPVTSCQNVTLCALPPPCAHPPSAPSHCYFYIFIQQLLSSHLLSARHYSQPWGYDKQYPNRTPSPLRAKKKVLFLLICHSFVLAFTTVNLMGVSQVKKAKSSTHFWLWNRHWLVAGDSIPLSTYLWRKWKEKSPSVVHPCEVYPVTQRSGIWA